MRKDITERLREGHYYSGIVDPQDTEAADEIDRLRGALTVIAEGGTDTLSGARELARLALTPTPT